MPTRLPAVARGHVWIYPTVELYDNMSTIEICYRKANGGINKYKYVFCKANGGISVYNML